MHLLWFNGWSTFCELLKSNRSTPNQGLRHTSCCPSSWALSWLPCAVKGFIHGWAQWGTQTQEQAVNKSTIAHVLPRGLMMAAQFEKYTALKGYWISAERPECVSSSLLTVSLYFLHLFIHFSLLAAGASSVVVGHPLDTVKVSSFICLVLILVIVSHKRRKPATHQVSLFCCTSCALYSSNQASLDALDAFSWCSLWEGRRYMWEDLWCAARKREWDKQQPCAFFKCIAGLYVKLFPDFHTHWSFKAWWDDETGHSGRDDKKGNR